MDYIFDVSIIIATFNPKLNQLLASVKAAINQKNISFELIITDDGSRMDFFPELISFFNENGFKNFRLIKNKENIGTVKNVYNAVLQSSARYVYLNSPGDYIFDDYAMSDFYHFAVKNKADICFGDYIPYSYHNHKFYFDDKHIYPQNVEVYNKSLNDYRISFFIGWGILGASYFRSRTYTIKSFNYIQQYSKYTEDGPSTAYGLLKNIPVFYYNRKIVWYEFDMGISSGKSAVWLEKIKADFLNTYRALLEDYPRSRILKASIYFHENEHKPNWMANFAIRYPIIAVKKLLFGKMPRRVLYPDDSEIARFRKEIMGTKNEN